MKPQLTAKMWRYVNSSSWKVKLISYSLNCHTVRIVCQCAGKTTWTIHELSYMYSWLLCSVCIVCLFYTWPRLAAYAGDIKYFDWLYCVHAACWKNGSHENYMGWNPSHPVWLIKPLTLRTAPPWFSTDKPNRYIYALSVTYAWRVWCLVFGPAIVGLLELVHFCESAPEGRPNDNQQHTIKHFVSHLHSHSCICGTYCTNHPLCVIA